jgi:hypothetical protein
MIKWTGQAFAYSKILKSRSPLEWTGPAAGLMLADMGQQNHVGNCPRCGRRVKLALLPAVSGTYDLQCCGCEKFDPLKSELVTGWLNGELGRPKRTFIQPK